MNYQTKSDLSLAIISLIFLLALASIGCSEPPAPDLGMRGSAVSIYPNIKNQAFNGIPAIENSMIVRDGTVKAWFDPAAVGSMEIADLGTSGLDFSAKQTVMTSGARFSYVIEHQGTLWNFVTSGHVYLYSSTDGITWTIANDGEPVLRAAPGTPYATLWNVGVDVDQNGVWHLLVEAADEAGSINQAGVGLGYSTAVMTGGRIEFDSNMSQQHVLPKGGNPYVKALSNGKIFVVHGQLWDPIFDLGSEWYTTASTLSGSTWTTHENFVIGTPGQHVCDPHMVDLPNGGSMISVSVAQNSISLATSTLTIEQIASQIGGQ